MATLATRSALAGLRIDRDRLSDVCPCGANLPGQLEHPGPQGIVVFDPVPRAVTTDDDAMRRPDSQLLLDQKEKDPHRARCQGRSVRAD